MGTNRSLPWPRQLAVMQRPLLFLAIALTLFVPVTAVKVSTTHADDASSQTLLVLGDSLSSAYGMSTEQGWVSLLQKRLNNKLSGTGAAQTASGDDNESNENEANLNGVSQSQAETKWSVVNASIAGDTATSGAARIGSLLTRHQPSVVIVELGGNDGLRGAPVETIRTALATILDAVHEAGAHALLVGMRMPPNYGPRYVTDFHAVYQTLAQQRNIAFVPFLLDGVATVDGMMQADRIHPAAAAQATMLDTVWTVLRPLLR